MRPCRAAASRSTELKETELRKGGRRRPRINVLRRTSREEPLMTANVLLLGRTGIVLDDVQSALEVTDVALFAGTSLDEVTAVMAANRSTT